MPFPNYNSMRNVIILCSLLLIINSCRNNDIPSPEKKELKSEKKLLEEIISPEFLTRFDDKLIISSSKSDHMSLVARSTDYISLRLLPLVASSTGNTGIRLLPLVASSTDCISFRFRRAVIGHFFDRAR
jgi:hypothetical protein